MTPRSRLRRFRAPLLGAVVLVLVSATAAALIPRPATRPERTYTLTQLLTVASQRPGPLIFPRGWTLRVQGVLVSAPPWVIPAAPHLYGLQDRVYHVPTAHGGLIIAGGSSIPLIAAAWRVPVLAPLLPPTADHPLLGRMATYRIEYIGPPPCPPSPCNPSPWRLLDGGS